MYSFYACGCLVTHASALPQSLKLKNANKHLLISQCIPLCRLIKNMCATRLLRIVHQTNIQGCSTALLCWLERSQGLFVRFQKLASSPMLDKCFKPATADWKPAFCGLGGWLKKTQRNVSTESRKYTHRHGTSRQSTIRPHTHVVDGDLRLLVVLAVVPVLVVAVRPACVCVCVVWGGYVHACAMRPYICMCMHAR